MIRFDDGTENGKNFMEYNGLTYCYVEHNIVEILPEQALIICVSSTSTVSGALYIQKCCTCLKKK